MQLICDFVFAYAEIRFSHDAAHFFDEWKLNVHFIGTNHVSDMRHVVRRAAFSICENKSRRSAPLFFRYIDSTITLLPKSEISSL